MLKYKRKNLIDIIEYFLDFLFAVLIILHSQTTMFHVMESKFWLFKGDLISTLNNLLFCLTLVYFLINCYNFSFKKIFFVLIIFFVLKFYIMIKPYNVGWYYKSFFKPIFCILIICSFSNVRDRFIGALRSYADIAFLISIFSLFFYVTGPILNFIEGKQFFFINGTQREGLNFYNLYFINYMQNRPFLGLNVVRNIGIFMEAPGFAFALSIALWWELFGRHKKNAIKLIVIVLTMLTTFSMKSYLILFVFAVVVFGGYCKKKSLISIDDKYKIQVLLIGLFVIASVAILYNIEMFRKMGSIAWRLEDTYAAIRTFLDYPITGCGYANVSELLKHHGWAEVYGGTAGIFNVFAYGGIYLGCFYLVPLMYPLFSKNIENDYKTFFLMTFLYICMTSFQFSYFIYFVMTVGYVLLVKDLSFKINKCFSKFIRASDCKEIN